MLMVPVLDRNLGLQAVGSAGGDGDPVDDVVLRDPGVAVEDLGGLEVNADPGSVSEDVKRPADDALPWMISLVPTSPK